MMYGFAYAGHSNCVVCIYQTVILLLPINNFVVFYTIFVLSFKDFEYIAMIEILRLTC